MDTIDTKLKPLSIHSATGNTNPEQMLLPVSRAQNLKAGNVSDNHVSAMLSAMFCFPSLSLNGKSPENGSDKIGNRFTPSFTFKKRRRYRYYVSQLSIKNPATKTQWPDSFAGARDENRVTEKLLSFLKSDAAVFVFHSRLPIQQNAPTREKKCDFSGLKIADSLLAGNSGGEMLAQDWYSADSLGCREIPQSFSANPRWK